MKKKIEQQNTSPFDTIAHLCMRREEVYRAEEGPKRNACHNAQTLTRTFTFTEADTHADTYSTGGGHVRVHARNCVVKPSHERSRTHAGSLRIKSVGGQDKRQDKRVADTMTVTRAKTLWSAEDTSKRPRALAGR